MVLNGRDGARLARSSAVAGRGSPGPGPVRTLVFDVTDHAAACVAEDEYEATPGPIDILVNSAGTTRQPQTGR